MPVQDVYIGLGNLIYALAKSEGLQQAKDQLEEIAQGEEYSLIALYSYWLKEIFNDHPEAAYQSAMRRFAANPADLTPERRTHFMQILNQLYYEGRGEGAEESAMLARIREDLEKYPGIQNAPIGMTSSGPEDPEKTGLESDRVVVWNRQY
jgi:hypothetical protein